MSPFVLISVCPLQNGRGAGGWWFKFVHWKWTQFRDDVLKTARATGRNFILQRRFIDFRFPSRGASALVRDKAQFTARDQGTLVRLWDSHRLGIM